MENLDPKYSALFTPWKIGNVEIKNRIVMCPMGGTSLFGWFELTGCHFDREAAKLFLERANNNVGLIIPGIAPLRDTFWGKWLWQNPKMFEDLKEFMDEIHKTGAKLFIQLTAGMGRSWAITELVAPLHKNKFTRALIKPILDTSHELASPSPQKSRWAHDIECPEMTVEQIHEIIEAFAKTAKLCRDAGVDGVEVHAVHEGYLLDQFAIEFFNKRTDDYGGSFENRYRFAAEVVRAIKEACGEDFPVCNQGWDDVNKFLRHRVNVDVTGQIALGRWKLSLRERLMLDARADEIDLSEKNRVDYTLRTRLQAVYSIPNLPLSVVSKVEMFNTLNAKYYGQYISEWRPELGIQWKVDSHNSLNLAYRYNYVYSRSVDTKDNYVVARYHDYTHKHVILLTYKFDW